MLIQVTIVHTKTGKVDCTFSAESSKYPLYKQAKPFLDKGFTWCSNSTFGTHAEIKAQS
jgi:hypothetical protein